jgi:two-component system CheB/CheR fusion protein
MAPEISQFKDLLDFLKRTRGFDVHAYKPAGLVRRIAKRLQATGIADYGGYLDHLEVHPEEFGELFNTILINVTGFFRDPQAWEFIENRVIPDIVAARGTDTIRVWSSGCASGQEAYTLAMLLAEQVGKKAFRERVKVYATDIDADALEQARQAAYSPREVQDVPEKLLQKYFERTPRGYVFDKELRRSVIFGRNDILQDAPISRLDLLVCRNTLMYFNAEAQNRILSRFHFALNDEGYLFLGKAELLLTHTSLFTPVEMKRRIFKKVPIAGRRERGLAPLLAEGDNGGGDSSHLKLRFAAFDLSPTAEIIVDAGGTVVHLNERAQALLGAGSRDAAGRPLASLDWIHRMDGLRNAVQQVQSELRPVILRGIEWTVGSDGMLVDIHVVPLAQGSVFDGLNICIIDMTRVKRLEEELSASREQLQGLSEELESTNEELETTNEELQSSNEELETTNEELQSTNEELETMNEELQSTNEELQTVNEEVRLRSEELLQANAFLESVLTSVRNGVVVLDEEMRVLVWNRRAEDLWGLRAEEVRGKHFLNLDIGLPVNELRQPIRMSLAGDGDAEPLLLEATNRRGKTIQCEVDVTPLMPEDRGMGGVILLMQERLPS